MVKRIYEMEMLPCPFCGGQPEFIKWRRWPWQKYTWSVQCEKCHCKAPFGKPFDSQLVAAMCWDTRKPQQ